MYEPCDVGTHNSTSLPFPVQAGKMKFWLAAIVVLCVTWTSEGETQPARLLASKNVLNQYLVEGRDLTVQYNIFNIGGSAAVGVTLKDSGFPETDFEVVRGNLEVRWERIAPGTNVSHSIIMKPIQYGYFNFTAAEVTYKDQEEGSELITGYTSSPGEGGIVNNKEFERRFSPHVLDWCVFAVMTLPSLVIPFLLFFRSKSRYNTNKTKKN